MVDEDASRKKENFCFGQSAHSFNEVAANCKPNDGVHQSKVPRDRFGQGARLMMEHD